MSTSASSSKIVRHVSKVCHVDEQQLYLSERVWACAWHFGGKLIASAGEDKTIKVFLRDYLKDFLIFKLKNKIWKCEEEENKQNNGKIEATSEGTIRGDQTRSIRWVCFSPCGRFLAAASFDATIIIYERNKSSNEFEELHKLEGHECEVKCCSFSISGHYLATCSRDKTVWIWKGLIQLT
ncbi:unnamed protein product [Meloidogyne enterolobii]|uniref:Uncharacterized protein n=1 Tax=Meloidogyne enterolobii TaxID=390850 RepID=A0ACB1AVZ8_MELEN